LAAGAHDLEDGIKEFAVTMFPGTSGFTGLGKTVVDALPFGIAEVSRISHPQLVSDLEQFKKLKITGF
jgi:hypothetical protein